MIGPIAQVPPAADSVAASATIIYPTKTELLACLSSEFTKIDTVKAWRSLAMSLGLSLLAYAAGTQIPLEFSAIPLWLLYAVTTGTVAGGCWVIAHECGHHAFHPDRRVERLVGFVLHSLLLVPYFTWQRSHAVHHGHCNHLECGETHVPPRIDSASGRWLEALHRLLGIRLFGLLSLAVHLLLGWPMYLLFGVNGGEEYGVFRSHFWPVAASGHGQRVLFPPSFRSSMLLSNLGLVVMLLALVWAAVQFSAARIVCLYGLPYLVINAWLVGYTWLQHTDVDLPHFSSQNWTWVQGAVQTVDRPYGPLLNLLHHGIGSTHVCHHINPRIPHYNAWQATRVLKRRFPELVRHDPTPIPQALWRVASRCWAVRRDPASGAFYY